MSETQDFRTIVKENYDKGDYVGYFRKSENPEKFEESYLVKLFDLLPKNADVLDLGYGAGIPFDKWLAEKGCSVIGIDNCVKHIKMAKKNVPSARFIKGDFSKITFSRTEKFDVVISFYAIFHIPKEEHESLFNKMAKTLKNGGILLITTTAKEEDGKANEK